MARGPKEGTEGEALIVPLGKKKKPPQSSELDNWREGETLEVDESKGEATIGRI